MLVVGCHPNTNRAFVAQRIGIQIIEGAKLTVYITMVRQSVSFIIAAAGTLI